MASQITGAQFVELDAMIIGSLRVLSNQCSRQSNDSLTPCARQETQRGKG